MSPMAILALSGVAIACLSVYQQLKGEDGFGWGIVAVLLFISSCNQTT